MQQQIEKYESDENFETPYEEILSPTNKRNWRNLVGFWILGMTNNYPYVIMLSAAFDLLHPNFHGNEENGSSSTNNTTNSTNSTGICNDVSTGAILLADILPSLFIKIVSPFLPITTQCRVLASVILSALSFILTSFSINNAMTFMGVICAALSSGLGEVTFLSYSANFDKNVVSTWSSGTGGAGVVGALSYTSLIYVFEVRHALQIMLIMPLLTAFTFWVILDHPSSAQRTCRNFFCMSERKPILEGDIDLTTIDTIPKSKRYTWHEKVSLVKPLLKYMIPLGIVYFAEYFINQGLMELLYFPNISSWMDHATQYRWYQVDYQIGVLISRSSVNLFQVHKLWILPILQMLNVIVLLMQVSFSYIPIIWIVLVLIFYEGLLGGCAYVNTFYKISSEVPDEDREFSMGIGSLADSMGIALAGLVALPVHNAFCRLPKFSS